MRDAFIRCLRPSYEDRADAGRQLAQKLRRLAPARPIVLGIPRGGISVALPIAEALGAPLDVILVRKLPIPSFPETAFGVEAEDGTTILDDETVAELNLSKEAIAETRRNVRDVLFRYARKFASARPRVTIKGSTVLLVDDGLATGYTMLGAARLCRKWGAARVVVAAPVAAGGAAELLRPEVEEFVCPIIDPAFLGVGAYYSDFLQVSDDEVLRLLLASAVGEEHARAA